MNGNSRTGRSPQGRLRNFAAMSPEKFQSVYTSVMLENNDREAMAKVEEVNRARRYYDGYAARNAVPLAAPEGIDQDVWDTLAALAV